MSAITELIERARQAHLRWQDMRGEPRQMELTEGLTLWASYDEYMEHFRATTEPYHDENCWVACPHNIKYPYPDFNGVTPDLILNDPKARD